MQGLVTPAVYHLRMTPPTILNALGSRQLREAFGSGPWSWSRNAATTAKPALLLRITLRGGFCFLVSRGRLASAFSQVVEAEVFEFLAATADLKSDDGCQRVVRHGHLPERQIMTVIACATGRRASSRRSRSPDPIPVRIDGRRRGVQGHAGGPQILV